MAFEMYEDGESGALLKVVGVGGAGGNVINNMIRKKVKGNIQFIAANTDRQALSTNLAESKIQLGHTGLGAGGKPEVGQAAANEAREEIADQLRGANMVFITAGMGGGTGTGAAAVVAEVAQELGILTVAVVTKPFTFEGGRRMKNAKGGIDALKARVHSLIIILNDKLEMELGEDATLIECFARADEVLYNAVAGISEIIQAPGLVNADFEDVRSVMSERGTAMMGSAEAEGQDRALQAASQAISCPLLEDIDVKGARGVLVNITASEGVKMSEVRIALDTIRNFADPDASIVFGNVFDETLGDKMRVTVIATGLDQEGEPTPWTPSHQSTPIRGQKEESSGVWRPSGEEVPPAAIGVDMFGQPDPAQSRPQEVFRKPSQPEPVNLFDIPTPPAAQPARQYESPFPQAPQSRPVKQEHAPQAEPYIQEKQPEMKAQPAPQQNNVHQNPQTVQPGPFAPSFMDSASYSAKEPQPERPAVAPQPSAPKKETIKPVQPSVQSPFGQAGAFSRPIAQPDDGFQVPPAQADNTIFGRMNERSAFHQGGFASLNPRSGQGSGLWSNNTNVQNVVDQQNKGDETPGFEHDIPAFLRKKD